MHLADGILADPAVLLGLNVAGGAGLVLAARRQANDSARDIAWTGTLGAFALALQALNVPLVPGASAHAVGAGLLTLALGPARAVVALTAVLVVQSLLLADGGVTVLGINILNLAVLPVLVMHACRTLLSARIGLPATAAIGTALGAIVGASSLALTLVLGARAPAGLTFGFLVGVQALAGVVEGLLTAAAVRHLMGRAPALLVRTEPAERSPVAFRGLLWTAVALGVTVALLPLASSQPDALEAVLERLGNAP